MSKTRSLLGSGSAVVAARLFSLGAAAIQLPLLTRFLTPTEYSALAVAIAVAAYFSLLSAEPVILGFERFPGSSLDRFNYRYGLVRTLGYVAIASAIVAAVAYPLGHIESAIAFVGWGIGVAVNRLISLAWLMWEKPWQYAWNLIAGTGVRTATLVSLIMLGWNPLISLGAAGVFSSIAALILSPKFRLRSLPRPERVRPWPFKFGMHLAFASLAVMILNNSNLLILAALAPGPTVGTYAAMLQVATLTSGALLGLILTVAYPPLRQAWDNGNQKLVHASLATLQSACLAVAFAVIVVFYLGNGFLLKIIIPTEFVDLALLAPLIMATSLATMGGIASWHHQLQLRAGLVATRTVVAAVFGVLSTLGLAVFFGERGAALGSVVGFVLYLVVMQIGTKLPSSTLVVAVISALTSSGTLLLPYAESPIVVVLAFVALAGTTYLAARSHRASPH